MIKEDILIKNGYLLFWRGYLSNWYPSPFTYEGITYTCLEQYMMAKKAELFGDKETQDKIMKAKTPREQKDLGREVKNYVDSTWAEKRYEIVRDGIVEKFKQNKELLEYLLNTGENILVEASPYDIIWGTGIGKEDPDAAVENKWKGQNLLGKALTEAREIIKNEIKV